MHTNSPEVATASPLDGLMTLEEYQQSHERFFRSVTSLRWFIRQRSKQLQDAGALFFINGRWWIKPPAFGECVMASAKRTGAAA